MDQDCNDPASLSLWLCRIWRNEMTNAVDNGAGDDQQHSLGSRFVPVAFRVGGCQPADDVRELVCFAV